MPTRCPATREHTMVETQGRILLSTTSEHSRRRCSWTRAQKQSSEVHRQALQSGKETQDWTTKQGVCHKPRKVTHHGEGRLPDQWLADGSLHICPLCSGRTVLLQVPPDLQQPLPIHRTTPCTPTHPTLGAVFSTRVPLSTSRNLWLPHSSHLQQGALKPGRICCPSRGWSWDGKEGASRKTNAPQTTREVCASSGWMGPRSPFSETTYSCQAHTRTRRLPTRPRRRRGRFQKRDKRATALPKEGQMSKAYTACLLQDSSRRDPLSSPSSACGARGQDETPPIGANLLCHDPTNLSGPGSSAVLRARLCRGTVGTSPATHQGMTHVRGTETSSTSQASSSLGSPVPRSQTPPSRSWSGLCDASQRSPWW